MERLINEQIANQVRDVFANLVHPVEMLVFVDPEDAVMNQQLEQLVGEIAGLSDHLSMRVLDLSQQPPEASQYGVNLAPSIVLLSQRGEQIVGGNVHYAGVPTGHEFAALIHDLLQVSQPDSGLSPASRDFLATLQEPVEVLVFSTPT